MKREDDPHVAELVEVIESGEVAWVWIEFENSARVADHE